MTDGVVQIRGKDYVTVARRVSDFRDKYPHDPIETEILKMDANHVVMRATIRVAGDVVAVGHAEEERGDTGINATSALENCETSAVGRALAFYGLAGSEIASANEQADALVAQKEKRLYANFVQLMEAVEAHHDSLRKIRGHLLEDNIDAAKEAWEEIPRDDQMALWVAPSKGGWLTTEERKQLKGLK